MECVVSGYQSFNLETPINEDLISLADLGINRRIRTKNETESETQNTRSTTKHQETLASGRTLATGIFKADRGSATRSNFRIPKALRLS
jgi:hypothetical protein